MTGRAEDLGAVVLAGGRSRRFGSDKAVATIDGVRLVDRAVAAARGAGAAPCVVVGPASLRPAVPVVQEDPPFGGPVAGIAAGVTALVRMALERGSAPAGAVLLLACDVADPGAAVADLLADPADGADGSCLLDGDGRPQWLAGLYRFEALARALTVLGDPSGRSVRDLVAPMQLRPVATGHGTQDVDTPADLQAARAFATKRPSSETRSLEPRRPARR